MKQAIRCAQRASVGLSHALQDHNMSHIADMKDIFITSIHYRWLFNLGRTAWSMLSFTTLMYDACTQSVNRDGNLESDDIALLRTLRKAIYGMAIATLMETLRDAFGAHDPGVDVLSADTAKDGSRCLDEARTELDELLLRLRDPPEGAMAALTPLARSVLELQATYLERCIENLDHFYIFCD